MSRTISVGGEHTSESDRFAIEQQLSESHTVLWAVVILASLFDVVTTIVGLGVGLTEGNAVAQAFIATYGTAGDRTVEVQRAGRRGRLLGVVRRPPSDGRPQWVCRRLYRRRRAERGDAGVGLTALTLQRATRTAHSLAGA